jgi:divalent metal cation (Fe/Co/Zn/Cd) transporter
MIGVSLFALAAYLAAESIHDLAVQARPRQSVAGLAVTAAALVVMPSLAIAKRGTGQAPGNRP